MYAGECDNLLPLWSREGCGNVRSCPSTLTQHGIRWHSRKSRPAARPKAGKACHFSADPCKGCRDSPRATAIALPSHA